MVPYLRAKDYDSAILTSVGEVAQVIAADAKVTLEDEPAAPPRHQQSALGALAKLIPFLILFLLFGGFGFFRLLFGLGLISNALGGPRIGGGGFGGGFGGGGGGGGGGSDFGGFGGGSFGGGGAGGSW